VLHHFFKPSSFDISAKILHLAAKNVNARFTEYGFEERHIATYTNTLPPPSPKFIDVTPLASAEDRILGDLHL
jgi:hypothetical protein